MEVQEALSFENFISHWNEEFSSSALKLADLTNPQKVMDSLLKIFERLRINKDFVLAPPPEEDRNNHMIYYQDMLPIINMIRIINHLVSVSHMSVVNIPYFLQPTVSSSHSILILLYNVMLFNEERLRNILPYEEELFDKNDQVKILEDRKNQLLEMLNEQAQEKGKRAERLAKLEKDMMMVEEEQKNLSELRDEEKQLLETILREEEQKQMALEQKKTPKEALLAKVERLKAVRVYDADDMKARAEKAAQDVQEAEKKLATLGDTLMKEENSLKNLQTVKTNLDTANGLLFEVIEQTDCLKDMETGDLESEGDDGELMYLQAKLNDVQTILQEVITARNEATQVRQQAQADRQLAEKNTLNDLRDAEEKDAKCRERSKRSQQRTEETKELTFKYEQEKARGMEELINIEKTAVNELKNTEVILLKKVEEVKKYIEEKVKSLDN